MSDETNAPAQVQVAPDPVAPAAPAPGVADAEARIRAMEEQNRQLAMYAAMLERTGGAAQQQQQVAPPSEEDNTDPEVRHLRGSVSQLQESLDRMQFGQMAASAGYGADVTRPVEEQMTSWARSGTTLVDATGTKRRPNRMDALQIVLGQQALATAQKAAPQRAQEQLRAMMGVDRGGAGPAGAPTPNAPIETDLLKLSTKERLKLMEQRLAGEF